MNDDDDAYTILSTPCDTCGAPGPVELDPLEVDDVERETAEAQWLETADMLGQPRCWDCCNPLIREALEADFVDVVMKGVEQGAYSAGDITLAREKADRFFRDRLYTYDDVGDDMLALAFIRQEFRAMRERIEAGRKGTWNQDAKFTPDEQGGDDE
jgi:hypothetical protein